jgi:Major Facilitator Superfamily
LGDRDHRVKATLSSRYAQNSVHPRVAFDASVVVHRADLLNPRSLATIEGDYTAPFYLVHSMGRGGDAHYEERDAAAASNFARFAVATGISRVIYLGGLGDRPGSQHLHSRLHVGEIQIGSPEILTYGQMLDQMTVALGRRPRLRIPVPLLTPWLSSHWIGLVTPVDAGVARPLIEGLSTARNKALRMLLVGEGVAFAFFYLVVPVTVVYASDSLHAGSGGYAAILAAWGAGIAIGSAAHVRLGRRIGPGLIFVSTSAVALGYLGTAAAPTLAAACAASVIGGIGNGTQWASVETAVHELVEDRFRARVAVVLEALAATAPGVGIALGGALTESFSPRVAYLVAGLGLAVLAGVGIMRRSTLSRRELDPGIAWAHDHGDRALHAQAGGDLG